MGGSGVWQPVYLFIMGLPIVSKGFYKGQGQGHPQGALEEKEGLQVGR